MLLYVLVRWLVKISAKVQETLTGISCFTESLEENPGLVPEIVLSFQLISN
jgi:hypothetical protein